LWLVLVGKLCETLRTLWCVKSEVGDCLYKLTANSQQPNKKHFANPTETPIFVPDIMTYNDYYPFGALMPTRHESSAAYRYGFNGKENDNNIKGTGNSVDFGARMYDPRVGRWFKTDNLERLYPEQGTYNFAINNPIYNIDPDGNIVIPWIVYSWFGSMSMPTFTNIYNADKKFLNSFATVSTSLIFKKIYIQLLSSPKYYKFQTYIVTGRDSYKIQKGRDAGQFIHSESKGTEKDPYLIQFRVDLSKKKTKINETVVFEEVFHAGQLEFQRKGGSQKSALAKEVEAKLAKNIEGFAVQDEGFGYEYMKFKDSKKIFKKIRDGIKLSSDELKNFREAITQLAKRVKKLYKLEGNNAKFDMDFDLDYLESLYGDILQNNDNNAVIISNDKKNK
jgi:RHS repeat-associated protein